MKPEQYRLFADIEQKHWWFLGRRTIVNSQYISERLDKRPWRMVTNAAY